MTVVLDRTATAARPAKRINPWMHVVWCGAAVLFISVLAWTYGLDLSPGLF